MGNLPETLTLYIQLKSLWSELVGDALKNYISLDRIKFTNKNELTVYTHILSSASLVVKGNSERIRSSIEKSLGIQSVKLVFQHASVLRSSANSNDSLNETTKSRDVKKPEYIDEVFENNDLKLALEKLKTEMQNAA